MNNQANSNWANFPPTLSLYSFSARQYTTVHYAPFEWCLHGNINNRVMFLESYLVLFRLMYGTIPPPASSIRILFQHG